MTRALIAVIGAGMLLPGCIIVDRAGHRRAGIRAERCHPSEYWDGSKCRHKGKGKNKGKDKRKHDDD